jgi:cytochrome P450
MAERESAVRFHRDPVRFLDQTFPAPGDAAWLPSRQLCLADAAASKAVLANADDLYEDHSDFFHTRRGLFGPRAAQERIARSSRELLRAYLAAHADGLPAAVQGLAPASEWPDAGNRLVYRHLAGALIAPDSPPRLRRTVDAIVERSVLAGARRRRSVLSRALFRFRALRELARAIELRRAAKSQEPIDLLDVVAGAADPAVPAAELAEIFGSFVFAIAGSVGFALGWSVYLLGTHPDDGAEADPAWPAWVAREALRLWPVAWMLARRPARDHQVAGVAVTAADHVVACPYAIHRNPRYWQDPASFRPERWATVSDHEAYIPFGWGPHRCVAAALSLQLVEDILRVLIERFQITLTAHDSRPFAGPALAPPRFSLGLAPHGHERHEERR